MNKSENINELAKSMSLMKAEVKNVYKANKAYNYKYANLGQVLDLIRPLLGKYDLDIIPSPGEVKTIGIINNTDQIKCLIDATKFMIETRDPNNRSETDLIFNMKKSIFDLCLTGSLIHYEATVNVILKHSSGQSITDSMSIPFVVPKGINEAQATGMIFSYARRYILCGFFNIAQSDTDASLLDVTPSNSIKSNGDSDQRLIITPKQISDINILINNDKERIKKICSRYEVKEMNQLTMSQGLEIIAILEGQKPESGSPKSRTELMKESTDKQLKKVA